MSNPFQEMMDVEKQFKYWHQHRSRLGILAEHFIEAEKSVPSWPEQSFAAVVVVPYLPTGDGMVGEVRTFHELWTLAADAQESSICTVPYNVESTHRMPLRSRTPHVPGLRVEVIDLDCERNVRPSELLKGDEGPLPSAGILAAAAVFPEWIRNMAVMPDWTVSQGRAPYVWLSGYELFGGHGHEWTEKPLLWFSQERREIALTYRDIEENRPFWAFPKYNSASSSIIAA